MNEFKHYLSFTDQVIYGGNIDLTSEMDKCLLIASSICKKIREDVFKTCGYTCSAGLFLRTWSKLYFAYDLYLGIAHNKMFSKMASPMNKPNKQTLVPFKYCSELLNTIPFQEIPGLYLSLVKYLYSSKKCVSYIQDLGENSD